MKPAFTLPSFAKINWSLRILGKRPDTFHELVTVFQTVSLHDTIHFADAEKLELRCDDDRIPVDERNLIIRAAIGLQKAAGVKKEALLFLEKRIPSPGGLGGGSSNAATALIGLARLWQLDFEASDLHTIATGLGSDVSFFLTGGTALGTGRGETIEPMDDIDEKWMLIVTPTINVSTREAFEGLNHATLTNDELNRILTVCRTGADLLDPCHPVLINDFEASVFHAYPEIGRLKQALLDLGAVNAALSGSGASVFAIFDNEETRQTAMKALDHESTWRKFAVATISRDMYRESLSI